MDERESMKKGVIRKAGLPLYRKTKEMVGWWSSFSCKNVLWSCPNSALATVAKGSVSQRTDLHQGLKIPTSGTRKLLGLEIGTSMERVEAECRGTAKARQGSCNKGIICNRQEQWHPAAQQKAIICTSTNQSVCSVSLLPSGQAVQLSLFKYFNLIHVPRIWWSGTGLPTALLLGSLSTACCDCEALYGIKRPRWWCFIHLCARTSLGRVCILGASSGRSSRHPTVPVFTVIYMRISGRRILLFSRVVAWCILTSWLMDNGQLNHSTQC